MANFPYMTDPPSEYERDWRWDWNRRLYRIGTLFDAIAHGSEEHRAWLKQAIEDHFAGRPVAESREE